ncbi:MAG TPA: hypothetical protein VKG65_02185 [Terriglobales bacterium]|nr:hypothetical protein [Terriglobales bacterium]
MRQIQWLVGLVVLTASVVPYSAAQRHDPLNAKEIDEMREAADYPDKRLELMTGFARARIASIEQLRADPKSAKDRPKQIHDLLQDFTALLDEIDDNIDMYGAHKTDMRKGLKLVIEADSEWHLQLRKLKEQSPPEELDQYSFVLTNAAEAVQDTGDSARKELQTQNELAKEKKLNKDYSERKN